MFLSVVIPAFNEEASIEPLLRELVGACAALQRPFEILVVDDGSSDATAARVRELAASDARLRLLSLGARCGKAAAYEAGFAAATGEVVATLDADLQNDPQALPDFLAALPPGGGVVLGRRTSRRRVELWKDLPSRVFNSLVRVLLAAPWRDMNTGYRVISRAVLPSLRMARGLYRFLPALARAAGWPVVEVDVVHRPRVHGVSKYGAARFLPALLDLFAVSLWLRRGPRHPLAARAWRWRFGDLAAPTITRAGRPGGAVAESLPAAGPPAP